MTTQVTAQRAHESYSAPNISIKEDFKATFDALTELFQRIAAFFQNLQCKPMHSRTVEETSEPVIKPSVKEKPSELKMKAHTHGMFAFKSVRKFISALHAENPMKFNPKRGSSIEYSITTLGQHPRDIKITGKQEQNKGKIKEESLILSFKDRDVTDFFQSIEHHEYFRLHDHRDLDNLARYMDFTEVEEASGEKHFIKMLIGEDDAKTYEKIASTSKTNLEKISAIDISQHKRKG